MGYWEEKREYEEERNKISKCSFCGKFGDIKAVCNGFHIFDGVMLNTHEQVFPLCSDCAKKCKKCRKYFCKKHIKNHRCR